MKETSNNLILNMCSLNSTYPELPLKIIQRDTYLDLFEEQFNNTRILCVNGSDGVGVTTTFALFAKRHAYKCVSYFNNGFYRSLLMPQNIELNIGKQLSFYATGNNIQYDENILQPNIYKAARRAKSKREFIYFVFDGFDKIPVENRDAIRQLLSPLFQIENARFLFSGKKKELKIILPDGVGISQSNEILRFLPAEVNELLREYIPTITYEQADIFYRLSNGNAEKLNILIDKYLVKNDINIIIDLYTNNIEDFYEEDWFFINNSEIKNNHLFWGLLAFSEIQLCKKKIINLLDISEENYCELLKNNELYILVEDDYIKIKSDSFHQYLQKRLYYLKSEIELLLIETFEKDENISFSFEHLPYLYKNVNNKAALVKYLTSENVELYLEKKKSQAALNEQCEYGFNACTDYNTQISEYFRFALNRSSSREIEKNELSDSEIEALIAVGDEEKAFTLTQDIFLLEERLKCLLIIARKGNKLPDSMQDEVKSQIKSLVKLIDFEHIPAKAIELAKLMLPVEFVGALSIIDKVAKISKDKSQIDKLYTAISLSYNSEEGASNEDQSKSDIINTRIADDGLRKMAFAMKSIMADCTVEQLLVELEKLPTSSSKLYFLQFWIPNHKDIENIQDIVLYAVKLAIEESNINIPRASLLNHYCTPLYKIKDSDIRIIIGMLDASVSLIKYPTIDYVNLQLSIIKALSRFDKIAAKDRLQNLYLEICEIEDKIIEIHCKSLILNQFEKLGVKKEVENWLMPAFELQKEITNDIITQFSIAAYHMKVIEGPIKELVCKYPTLISDIISHMNTGERKSRAYLLAVTEYIRQTDVEKLDWEYLNLLFNHVCCDMALLEKPLIILIQNIVHYKGDKTVILLNIKRNYDKFDYIEASSSKCYVLSLIYVWLKNNFTADSFTDKVKEDLERTWENIDVPWIKVEVGYEIAKQLSKISLKKEARDYVNKTTELRKNQLLSSYSCVAAYHESLSLYIHSLGILIRANLCDEKDLEQFQNILSYDDSRGEAMIAWSRIALEYYIANDYNNFSNVVNKYLSTPIDNFSKFYQKRVFLNISIALFLAGPTLFYKRLNTFDDSFANKCLENIGSFIRFKYPYPEYTDSREIQVCNTLDYRDYENLLSLLEYSKDECFILNYVEIIAQGLKENTGNRLSREQRNFIFDKLEEIVSAKLPMVGGIQHNGYKIACQAAIEGSKNISVDWDDFNKQIELINNISDQSFLFSYVSHYIKKVNLRSEFLNNSLSKAEQINNGFDRLNRLDMCLVETYDTTSGLARQIAERVIKSLLADKNGTYQDYKKVIDIIREHDEELAYNMLDLVDKDPARSQYKNKLKKHIESKKKLDAARQDIKQVATFTNEEQIKFFEKLLENLVKKKYVIRDVTSTYSIIKLIHENPITDASNAIIFFIENLYAKHSQNNLYTSLIRSIHQSILFNLKIVLAIASGTQERLNRINRIMDHSYDSNTNAFVKVGQTEKGIKILQQWYKDNPYDTLRIIDPYFHPEDLHIIKSFFDINNNLRVNILTHKQKIPSIEIFQTGWNKVSTDLTGSMEIMTVCFEEEPQKCPIHDRWWILYNNETDESIGKRLQSLSGLGKRESEISEMSVSSVNSAQDLWIKYFFNRIPKVDEHRLLYDDIKIK